MSNVIEKVLINFSEYQRLLEVEKMYHELEKSTRHSGSTQVGAGQDTESQELDSQAPKPKVEVEEAKKDLEGGGNEDDFNEKVALSVAKNADNAEKETPVPAPLPPIDLPPVTSDEPWWYLGQEE